MPFSYNCGPDSSHMLFDCRGYVVEDFADHHCIDTAPELPVIARSPVSDTSYLVRALCLILICLLA